MKYRHVFWAFILIAVGVLFMLGNLRVVNFGFLTLLSLWPLILVLWGISILPIKDSIKIISLVAVLALTIIFFNRITDQSSWFHFQDFRSFARHHHVQVDDETEADNYDPQNQSVPNDTTCVKGVLSLDAAAGNFFLQGVTSDFLTFEKTGDIGKYRIEPSSENKPKRIKISLEKSGISHSLNDNKVLIKLNEKPTWNLDLDIGAAKVMMDLRDYKIDTTTINAGLAAIDIKIGDKNPLTVMTLNSGLVNVNIEIPKESACQIKSESFLINKNFNGFTKKGQGIYQTDNFDTAKNKILITVKTAVSGIEISRY